MKFKLNKDWLPVAGIVAFSACSVNAVANLFFAWSEHDTPLFWAAACLVELCTAWLVWSVVETTRKVTKSNVSKQDRRFHSIILTVFLVLSIPSLGASIVANWLEFGRNVLLGLLFPTLSIACAVGAGLPETVKRHESQKQEESRESQRKRKANAKAKQEAERMRQETERNLQEAESKAQETSKMLSTLGKAAETLTLLAANPEQTQTSIAQALSISRQAISQHFAKLEQAGAIKKDNGQVEILWEL